MPKNKVKTIPVNKDVFLAVIQKKGFSLRKLGDVHELDGSEKTYRRALNDGQIRPFYIEEISKFLNVSSDILTGSFLLQFEKNAEMKEMIYKRVINNLDKYTYAQEKHQRAVLEETEEIQKKILTLFAIGHEQLEQKDPEEQRNFHMDLLNSIYAVIRKHFDHNVYGKADPEMYECYRIIYDLEMYYDNQKEEEIANNDIRPEWLKKPPAGYTKDDIKKMPAHELFDLFVYLQNKD